MLLPISKSTTCASLSFLFCAVKNVNDFRQSEPAMPELKSAAPHSLDAASRNASSTSDRRTTKTLNEAREIDQSEWQQQIQLHRSHLHFFTFRSEIGRAHV